MAIRSHFGHGIFDEDAIALLTKAFESALEKAKITDRLSPRAEVLAERVVRIFETGERDSEEIARLAASQPI